MANTGLSYGQSGELLPDKVAVGIETVDSTKNNNDQLSLKHDLERYIYTDTLYRYSTGKGITIQNSYPKGGMIEPDGTQYSDPTGKKYPLVVFWTRIINETTTPLELNIDFPADSIPIYSPPDSYIKLFLPTDKMTFDKLSMFNYGITGLKFFLDTNLNNATMLQRTINPNEEYVFYVALLANLPSNGPVRAGLVLKEQDFFYSTNIDTIGSKLIPCGQFIFKKSKQ